MEKAVDDGRNRHGFPRGYRFVPHDLELMHLLDEQLAGHRLPYPLPSIFHHVRIRDFHPAHLYEEYREHKEAGYIYFFDHREYRTAGRGAARATKDGGWKASGGGKVLRRGGVVLGNKLTMVFYEKENHPNKTDWALQEYTRIVAGHEKKVEGLALYRLYKMKAGGGAVDVDDAAYSSTAGADPAPAEVETAGRTSTANHARVLSNYPPLPALPLPAPAPATEGYLADEFKVWCESTKQEEPQGASPCWFPMPYDDLTPYLPMLMDESELFSCTFEELLLAPMQDAPATSMPDSNQDDTAAPATSTPTIRFNLEQHGQSNRYQPENY